MATHPPPLQELQQPWRPAAAAAKPAQQSEVVGTENEKTKKYAAPGPYPSQRIRAFQRLLFERGFKTAPVLDNRWDTEGSVSLIWERSPEVIVVSFVNSEDDIGLSTYTATVSYKAMESAANAVVRLAKAMGM
jgi:hypothetical protein